MTQLNRIKAFSKPLVAQLEKLNIHDLQGLLLHLPLRYLDETHITAVRDLRIGDSAQVEGEIAHVEVSYKPRKALIARLEDATGQVSLRFLNFYPSQITALKVGTKIRAYGEVRHGYFGYEMVHPNYQSVDKTTAVKETLTPIYSTVAGLSQIKLRKAIEVALTLACPIQAGQLKETETSIAFSHLLSETLPPTLYRSLNLPTFADSIKTLHYPPANADLQQLERKTTLEWQRLALDELLAQQLSMRKHYARRRSVDAPQFQPSNRLLNALLSNLPFKLTQSQQRVALEIERDLNQVHPMQRLLQGDVGSGKTIVACMAALQCIENDWQVALMVPTEILAEQHYQKMQSWLAPLQINIAWLTGGQTKKDRMLTLQAIADGSAQLVVGTHALFQETVQFKKLGLAIIDEQHRFGVQQRLALRQKGQPEPHQLMMTATPIPRTLSMSYYADLDVSVIDELPPGRTPIITKLVSVIRRDEVLQRVRNACAQGSQAYWVCPLIEESEVLQLAAANDTYALMKSVLPELNIGLLHGRMKPAEKQAVMTAFSAGHLQLLVATTVIEVGVDVPNANLMVIEHAERMGLSQLHQLRGRVGRGMSKSTCILLYQHNPSNHPLSKLARARLKVIYENNDGFAIAQADLNLRGPGEFLGVRQSGVPMLKIADLNRDELLLNHAKNWADKLLKQYPEAVDKHLERWMAHAAELVNV